MVTCEYHREDQKKRWKPQSSDGSSANALNFVHISRLHWESHQKGGFIQNKITGLKWSHLRQALRHQTKT